MSKSTFLRPALNNVGFVGFVRSRRLFALAQYSPDLSVHNIADFGAAVGAAVAFAAIAIAGAKHKWGHSQKLVDCVAAAAVKSLNEVPVVVDGD